MIRIVIDTNVFVAGMRSAGGASRVVLRKALTGPFKALFGNALWQEYQDLLGRPVWDKRLTDQDRREVLAALAKQGEWVTVYYGWRPNLPDEGDNHLMDWPWRVAHKPSSPIICETFKAGICGWAHCRF